MHHWNLQRPRTWCRSMSYCPLLFPLCIPKLSYTRILNSASIAARVLGFVVEGKRRSVEPSVVACSCGLAPLCFDGLHLLPSEQPAIRGKKWTKKKHDANFPTLTLFDTHKIEQKQTGQQIIGNGIFFFNFKCFANIEKTCHGKNESEGRKRKQEACCCKFHHTHSVSHSQEHKQTS